MFPFSFLNVTQTQQEGMESTLSLETIRDSFFALLEEFKQNAIQYHLNPNDSDAQNFFHQTQQQLESLNQQLISYTQQTRRNIQQLSQQTTSRKQHSLSDKHTLSELNDQQHQLQMTKQGSKIMLSDYDALYTQQLLITWLWALGFFGVSSFAYNKLFRHQSS